MIQKTTLSFIKFFILFSIILFTKSNTYAQTIATQQLPFDRICAGDIVDGKKFNEYFVTFSYLDFTSDVVFEVELSDPSGNFTTPVATTTLEVIQVSTTQQMIKFAVPTTLVGSDSYSLRIKSNKGVNSPRAKNFSGEVTFAAFYSDYVSSFSINNQSPTAAFCSGGSFTLSVDNPTPNIKESSPVNYPNLKYKWYKDKVLIAGQSSSTLLVNATGEYYAEMDYGQCSQANFSSNRVNVTSANSGSGVTVDSSLGNPFCSNGTGTVLTATSGNSYVWKKDGVALAATTRSITTNDSGLYTVEVDFGGCKATGSINLSSNGFNASIDIDEETTIEEGQTINVSVTTDATSPTYQWYLNNNLITGATTDSYLVAVRGNYKVVISQASGCVSTREFTFRVIGNSGPASVIPNIINLNGLNPYWNIPNEYKNADTKVMIISSNGDMVLDVVDYQGDWPQTSIDFKNVNPVYYYVIQSDTGEKKGSITVIK